MCFYFLLFFSWPEFSAPEKGAKFTLQLIVWISSVGRPVFWKYINIPMETGGSYNFGYILSCLPLTLPSCAFLEAVGEQICREIDGLGSWSVQTPARMFRANVWMWHAKEKITSFASRRWISRIGVISSLSSENDRRYWQYIVCTENYHWHSSMSAVDFEVASRALSWGWCTIWYSLMMVLFSPWDDEAFHKISSSTLTSS